MSKEAFANLVVTKLKSTIGTDGTKYSAMTATEAQNAIAEAITQYLVANTRINIAYNGVFDNGSGADVIEADSMQLEGTCSSTGRPSDYASWISNLQSAIAFSFSVRSPSTNGVLATFKPFNPTAGSLTIPQSKLAAACTGNSTNPTLAVWGVICGSIIDWINTGKGKNPTIATVPATRNGASTGSVSLVSIVVN